MLAHSRHDAVVEHLQLKKQIAAIKNILVRPPYDVPSRSDSYARRAARCGNVYKVLQEQRMSIV